MGEPVCGWYHSHPGYGCWLSGTDVQTQMTYQSHQEPFLAVVVDPIRTCAAGKVEIGAFRTYPEGYNPPDETPSEYQSIPLDKIEDCVQKLEQIDTAAVSQFRFRMVMHEPKKRKDENPLSKVSVDAAKMAGEQVQGLTSQVVKFAMFNCNCRPLACLGEGATAMES